MISRLDTPLEFQETLDRGELGLNYGGYFVYRTQQNDYNPDGLDPTDTNPGQLGDPANPNAYVLRDYKSYTLDSWLHFGWDQLDIQIEGAAILGHIGNVSDIGVDPDPTTTTRPTSSSTPTASTSASSAASSA
jgi:hypothetical protein